MLTPEMNPEIDILKIGYFYTTIFKMPKKAGL